MRVGGAFAFGQEARTLLVCGEDRVDQRRLAARCLLRDSPDPPQTRERNVAAFPVGLARNQPKERGLARAVAADEAHFVPGRNRGRRVLEQQAALDAKREI